MSNFTNTIAINIAATSYMKLSFVIMFQKRVDVTFILYKFISKFPLKAAAVDRYVVRQADRHCSCCYCLFWLSQMKFYLIKFCIGETVQKLNESFNGRRTGLKLVLNIQVNMCFVKVKFYLDIFMKVVAKVRLIKCKYYKNKKAVK